MENLDRLFRGAKRIKPPQGMWERIEAGAGMDRAKTDRAKTLPEKEPAGSRWGWRMAASFAVGLGALAALLVFNPGTGKPEGKAGADSLMQPVASAAASSAGAAAEENVMDDVLDWHADLGEAADWDDEVLPVSFLEE